MTTAAPIQSVRRAAPKAVRCGLALDVLALFVILALNWLCYVRVINGFFLADDFLHVAYLKHVFDGDWMSLLKNFWSNWMQAEGTTFYRPFISLTLAFDYWLFGANAAGFHLSNLFFQSAASLLLYLVAKDIGRLLIGGAEAEAAAANDGSASSAQGKGRAHSDIDIRLAALAAAAFFSVSPLHCEVVAWIIARVDSVACMFYLASFSLFLVALRKPKEAAKLPMTLSLIAFAFSLCSKEMAITLPPTIALLLLLKQDPQAESGFRTKFFSAIKTSLPFWIMLVAYLIFRTFALGTISGGYQGSIGEGLAGSVAKRWLLDGSYLRVLFPLNLDVFGHGHGLFKTLKVLYAMAAVNFIFAFFSAKNKGPAWRSVTFGLGWLILSLLPTYQVWNLTETLQGSRFAYFATMPLAYMLALLVIPPVAATSFYAWRFLLPLRLALLSFLIFVLATVTIKNNEPWQHAMTELKAFQTALSTLVAASGDKQIVLLNIPQTYRGAHMLYNAATMSVMLSPPMTTSNISERIYTFEPATYGNADLISISRLRRLAAQNNNILYRWDRNTFQIKAVPFKSANSVGKKGLGDRNILLNQTIASSGQSPFILTSDNLAISPQLNLNAADVDALAVTLSTGSKETPAAAGEGKADKNAVLDLVFEGDDMTLPLDNKTGTIIFQLSEHKNWLKQGLVKELSLKTIGASQPLQISSVELLSLSEQSPKIMADGVNLVEGVDGICRVHGPRASFSYDVSNVPGAVSAICEISKPNSWFEHYSDSFRDRAPSEKAATIAPFSKLKGRNILLSFAGPIGHGFYQIKVAALDKDGNVLGYFSDPLNFQI